MSTSRLPDFVVIGATKAATTWILFNLRAQPQVFMPTPELHYFSRHYDQGDAWYAAHFAAAADAAVVGEKSASYLPHPDAPARLKALLPRARLIAQLRNPIERAYSDYCMHYRRGDVGRDIERHFDPARTPIPRLLEDGLYHRHLSTWLRHFPREQIQIVLYDDIRAEPGPVLRAVCAHVGIAAPAVEQTLGRRVKDKETPVVPPTARRLLSPFKGLVAPVRHTAAFRSARALIARRPSYPELTPALRDRLAAFYAVDVEALSALLDRDLGTWLSPSARRQAA